MVGAQAKPAEGRPPLNFHYAVLSLAGLHYQFHQYDGAIRAIHETVRVAQENNDSICLQHALAWLTKVADGPVSAKLTELFLKSTAAP